MRYETRTKLTPERVMQEAEGFFGNGGLGLTTTQRAAGLAIWEGGGGSVSIIANPDEGAKRTTVQLTTTEWDRQVQEFMRKIGGRA